VFGDYLTQDYLQLIHDHDTSCFHPRGNYGERRKDIWFLGIVGSFIHYADIVIFCYLVTCAIALMAVNEFLVVSGCWQI